jgi:hypothetical protein
MLESITQSDEASAPSRLMQNAARRFYGWAGVSAYLLWNTWRLMSVQNTVNKKTSASMPMSTPNWDPLLPRLN